MPTTQAYSHEQFISVPSGQSVNLPILRGAIAALVLTAPVSNVEPQRGGGALVSWEDLPVAADIAAVTAVVVAHTGLVTTSAPQQFSQLADVDAPSSTFVDVLNVQAQPAEAGTYLVLGATDLYMPAVVTNTFIRSEFAIQINAGPVIVISRTTFQSTDSAHSGGFNPHAMLALEAGQRLRMILRIAKLGAAAATARASNSRMSYCRVE